MDNDQRDKIYPDNTDLYRRMEARKKLEAKRPLSEKLAALERLCDFGRATAGQREMNKALRAAKQIKIRFKTR
jgi:hypothetical protein